MNIFDTIAAPATPPGESGIGIIRLSGPQAIEIAEQVFRSSGKKLREQTSHTVHYGKIVDRKGQMIDEVLLLLLKAPHTFTREDTIEIDSHGGPYVMNQILQILIEAGARIAEPGEFTKRAFLNGRIDLSQAEAVMDMIHAKSRLSLDSASRRLNGRLGERIEKMRQRLMDLLVLMEVQIDYPEYEIEEAQKFDEEKTIQEVLEDLLQLYRTADTGRMLNEGIRVVLCGRPNMGKSTLMNAFLGEERAIVTSIPGTTRDTLEESMNLDGIPIRLIDTAGIRNSQDLVEQMGVQRSKDALLSGDLVLFLLDAAGTLTKEDYDILDSVKDKPVILVITKADLQEANPEKMLKMLEDGGIPPMNAAVISALQGEGMENLKKMIRSRVLDGQVQSDDGVYLANLRQKQAVYRAIESLERAKEACISDLGSDMASMDIQEAYDALGELTGNSVSEDLIDTIFSRFCLGK